jgi:cyanophycinase
MSRGILSLLAMLSVAVALPCSGQRNDPYQYFRLGNPSDTHTKTQPGFALMGGGKDLDDAFRWLCERSGGGDFLVLRATGDGDYDPYIQGLCKLNSVATVVIPNRTATRDPFVVEKIRNAGALFIAGGDQANYINFWMGTPVQVELNAAIERGVPIGGTSAGLAVLSEYAYSAQGDKTDDPNLDGKTALADPFNARVSLVSGFLDIPILKNVITDTHFAKRDRMGRLVVFLARLNQPDNASTSNPLEIRGIGVEERAAVMLEPDGRAKIIGHGSAYFVTLTEKAEVLAPAKPLTLRAIDVERVPAGRAFNLKTWTGEAARYTLSAEAGQLHSTQVDGKIY